VTFILRNIFSMDLTCESFHKPTLKMNPCFLLGNPEQTPLAGGARVDIAHRRREEAWCRRFDPEGSLDRRVNCRCVSQPRWVGARRTTRGNQKGNRSSCCPAPRADAFAVGGYKRSRGREGESLSVSPFSRAATSSYEGPGPSFYRCKERVQVYNGGVAMC
jgi:hypothetical protein